MTTHEIIILIQTVVFIITGLIIYLYTRETYKLRKLTNEQNSILNDQLNLMEKKMDVDLSNLVSLNDPVFFWTHGTGTSCHFENKGMVIKNIKGIPIDNFSIKVEPHDTITHNQKGIITFKNIPEPPPNELKFKIDYNNLLGQKRSKNFIYLPKESKVEEI